MYSTTELDPLNLDKTIEFRQKFRQVPTLISISNLHVVLVLHEPFLHKFDLIRAFQSKF